MIHDLIIERIREQLEDDLIDSIPEFDTARAGVVLQGWNQGNPDPDIGRIVVTVHENDPDQLIGGAGMQRQWQDEPVMIECGDGEGKTTWSRKFTVKARCLLEATQEEIEEARVIASTVRSRIEKSLLGTDFGGVASDEERVVQGVRSYAMRGEMLQSGGPGSYDFHIKIRFDVWTTET